MQARVIVLVRLVDGSLIKLETSQTFLDKLAALQREGFLGSDLVHRLIPDDWSPPAALVMVKGVDDNGHAVDITLACDAKAPRRGGGA